MGLKIGLNCQVVKAPNETSYPMHSCGAEAFTLGSPRVGREAWLCALPGGVGRLMRVGWESWPLPSTMAEKTELCTSPLAYKTLEDLREATGPARAMRGGTQGLLGGKVRLFLLYQAWWAE